MDRQTRKRIEAMVLYEGGITGRHRMDKSTIVCPFCRYDYEQGVSSSEEWKPLRSMSVKRTEDGVLYNCFRAGCKNGRGFISLVDQLNTKPKTKEFQPKQYKYRTNTADAAELSNVSGVPITQEEVYRNYIKYSPDRKTYVFPIFDKDSREIALLDRSYNERKPKTILYPLNDVPILHFPQIALPEGHNKYNYIYYEYKYTGLMVVEDVPSSIVGNRYIKTAALLGTTLNEDKVKILRGISRKLCLALDPDATDKAIDFAKKYSIFFDSIDVLLFPKDVKDCTDKEIRKVLDNVK